MSYFDRVKDLNDQLNQNLSTIENFDQTLVNNKVTNRIRNILDQTEQTTDAIKDFTESVGTAMGVYNSWKLMRSLRNKRKGIKDDDEKGEEEVEGEGEGQGQEEQSIVTEDTQGNEPGLGGEEAQNAEDILNENDLLPEGSGEILEGASINSPMSEATRAYIDSVGGNVEEQTGEIGVDETFNTPIASPGTTTNVIGDVIRSQNAESRQAVVEEDQPVDNSILPTENEMKNLSEYEPETKEMTTQTEPENITGEETQTVADNTLGETGEVAGEVAGEVGGEVAAETAGETAAITAGSALESIPVVGQVVGTLAILGGLLGEVFEGEKEKREEKKAEKIEKQQSLVQTTGMSRTAVSEDQSARGLV